MHFKSVFKSLKEALIKEKNVLALSDIKICLVTLSSEQSRHDRKQTPYSSTSLLSALNAV